MPVVLNLKGPFLALLALSLALPGVADLAWDFDVDTQGWNIADLKTGGPYLNPINTYSLQWISSGGDPGGFVRGLDPSSNSFFFNAPGESLGNLAAYAGGAIAFSLRCSHRSWGSDACVVLIGGGSAIVSPISPLPYTTWGRYKIPLVRSAWRSNNLNGAVVSQATFDAVLQNVSALRICAEFGAQVEETTELDTVWVRQAAPIRGKIELQDYVGSPWPPAAIDLHQGSTVESFASVPLGAEGEYEIRTTMRGTIDVYAKASHWLRRHLGTINMDAGGASGVDGSLLNGDVDGDNAVTVFDYNLLGEAFDTSAGDPGYSGQADLDGDGAVTVFDYNILSTNFDQVGD